MKHKTKSLDLWKKYNQLCRDNPALCTRINADPWVIAILAGMSAMLRAVPNAPRELLTDLTTVAPIPHALYFGEPCPFRERRSRTAEQAQLLYSEFASSTDELRQALLAWAGVPGFLRGALTWLEDLDARITIDTLLGEESNQSLCAVWHGFAWQLRDRIWTLARVASSIRSTATFRESA